MRVYVSQTRYRPQMGFWARVASFLSFAAFAVGHVLWHGREYDLIIASSSPLTMAIPALLAHWLHKTPFVFEVIDVWPDAAIAAGVLRNPLLKWLAFRLESCAYCEAGGIVTCSPGMTDRIVRKGVAPDKVSTLSNCCDLQAFRPDPVARAAIRGRMAVRDDQLVVLYTGALGRSNAVDDLVETVERTAADGRMVWWVAGDGAEAAALKNMPAVRFFGTLSRTKVAELYLAADAAVVTFHHAPLFEENSPNKFFDAIAAGLPVVFNRSTWLGADISRYCCGYVCTEASPAQEMAGRLQEWAENPALRQQMGANARRLAEEQFSRDAFADLYAGVVKRSAAQAQGS